MENDKKLTISVGRSRKEALWRPQTIMWSDFIEKLKTPAESTETLEAYKALKKPRQDDLKDVGGFVGGTLKNGRRKSGNVLARCLVTLDADHIPAGGTEDTLKRVEALGCAYTVYSTRKHEPAAPRLRILIPTDRDMAADEYEPVARKLAEIVGMGIFDPTTFEASRLMYWPSCCRGAEYVFRYGDKPFLAVDGTLALYKDWQDVRSWPQVPGADKPIERSLKRQQDPTEKIGTVGAFCRVYDIPTAIERFLPDTYEPCGEGRYTYAGGSTAGGAVLYDGGNFLYSHHATDPASGKLCNAFDLVRLHKFGHLDDESIPNTPTPKLPSYKAMNDLAMKDPDVFRQAMTEEFRELPEEETDWLKQLDRNGERFARTIKNVQLILSNDPRLKGHFLKDTFSGWVELIGIVPWSKEEGRRPLTDTDESCLRGFLETEYGITGVQKIRDALEAHLESNSTHAVREYLKGLNWDGMKRLDAALSDYLGAEDTPYTRAVSRKMFCAGVARVMEPGVKFDYMPVLIGDQGTYKSTFVRIMGVDWYTDDLSVQDMARDKTGAEKLQGKWAVEVPELTGMNKAEDNAIKSFLSRTADVYRPAYGRHTVNRPRQCVIVGTTNQDAFLKDETGNRRFWPIVCDQQPRKKSVPGLLETEIDQLWAEAKCYWQVGEPLYLSGEILEEAKRQQEAHFTEDPLIGVIESFLQKKIPAGWYSWDEDKRMCFNSFTYAGEWIERDKICAAEIWVECLGNRLKDMRQKDARQINAILKKLLPDWEEARPHFKGQYGQQRGFYRQLSVSPEETERQNEN